jgi:serine/threonine-protein kinase
VALKMMSHRLVYDAESSKRFQREADIIQSLDHPNICRMHGRFAAFHTFFIVMEYCDGMTLDELLQRHGSLPPVEIQKILGQIAAALWHAHQADIAHRDIKPSNVMILRDGTVKLMDFGLATPLSGEAADDDESLLGTPRYMAPEQLLGGRADATADYFSLGALAYELVTCRPLFTTNDLAELLHLHGTSLPASFAAACPDAESAIGQAFAHALDKDVMTRKLDLAEIATWAAPVDSKILCPARHS